MPRAMQLTLPVNIRRQATSKEDISKRKKHGQIKGRPRRVEEGSKVVKCSIKPAKFAQLERIRPGFSATMPDVIRIAVERFVLRYGNGEGLEAPAEREKRVAATERCHYVKVPLPPSHVTAIESLAVKLGLVNRQSVVDRAVTEFIEGQI